MPSCLVGKQRTLYFTITWGDPVGDEGTFALSVLGGDEEVLVPMEIKGRKGGGVFENSFYRTNGRDGGAAKRDRRAAALFTMPWTRACGS